MPGWGVERIADAWARVMAHLGFERFGAAGTDWGTSISTLLALPHPERIAGIHLVPPLAAAGPPEGATPWERDALADLARRGDDGSGYSAMHATRPQAIGYGLVDSPVALGAWMAEKLVTWADNGPAPAGAQTDPDHAPGTPALTPDQVLDAVTLYWVTASGARRPASTGRASASCRVVHRAADRDGRRANRVLDLPPRGASGVSAVGRVAVHRQLARRCSSTSCGRSSGTSASGQAPGVRTGGWRRRGSTSLRR